MSVPVSVSGTELVPVSVSVSGTELVSASVSVSGAEPVSVSVSVSGVELVSASVSPGSTSSIFSDSTTEPPVSAAIKSVRSWSIPSASATTWVEEKTVKLASRIDSTRLKRCIQTFPSA